MSLAWGCAGNVVKLVIEAMQGIASCNTTAIAARTNRLAVSAPRHHANMSTTNSTKMASRL